MNSTPRHVKHFSSKSDDPVFAWSADCHTCRGQPKRQAPKGCQNKRWTCRCKGEVATCFAKDKVKFKTSWPAGRPFKLQGEPKQIQKNPGHPFWMYIKVDKTRPNYILWSFAGASTIKSSNSFHKGFKKKYFSSVPSVGRSPRSFDVQFQHPAGPPFRRLGCNIVRKFQIFSCMWQTNVFSRVVRQSFVLHCSKFQVESSRTCLPEGSPWGRRETTKPTLISTLTTSASKIQ